MGDSNDRLMDWKRFKWLDPRIGPVFWCFCFLSNLSLAAGTLWLISGVLSRTIQWQTRFCTILRRAPQRATSPAIFVEWLRHNNHCIDDFCFSFCSASPCDPPENPIRLEKVEFLIVSWLLMPLRIQNLAEKSESSHLEKLWSRIWLTFCLVALLPTMQKLLSQGFSTASS